MSRLTELLRIAKQLDPQLGADLEAEVLPLQKRLPFGLNFERHAPEAVELAGHRIRKGSKVRVLAPRGSTARGDQRIWRVNAVSGESADLSLLDSSDGETLSATLDDLVLVAEFRDRIYPGLRPDGVEVRGGDKPFHTVINGENFHVLELLTFTHEQSVDAIYIDPPYNTGARDWKYNNDYVEGDDLYRHSKWLAFMERRLKVAKRLLRPDDSVLIVTIDEKEYLRLGLLLEQTFPEARIQMVSSVINPAGSARSGGLSRTDEYLFLVMFGAAAPAILPLRDEWRTAPGTTTSQSLAWENLLRRGSAAARSDRPTMFFPIYLTADCLKVLGIGDALKLNDSREEHAVPEDAVAVWPLRSDGSEGRWKVGPDTLRTLLERGYVRVGRPRGDRTALSYLPIGEQRKVASGDFEVVGNRPDGSVEVDGNGSGRRFVPGTQWRIPSHNAAEYGSNLNFSILNTRSFQYPKSLYAVEDVLRFFVKKKPNAVVLDFFSGSGTTAHAVMRLNRQDAGRRQSISVTNNEVSSEEQVRLRRQKLRPGDVEWEQWGICDHITKPRIRAAITGLRPDGVSIEGDYKFVDESPMEDGFEENAAFFTLTYESPWMVGNDRAFSAIAPMLWLRAGATGSRIDAVTNGWAIAESYGILRDLDLASDFIAAIHEAGDLRIAYIVTDDEGRYQQVTNELQGIETVRLYEDYLRNCESTGDF